jgi:hypothetical protein
MGKLGDPIEAYQARDYFSVNFIKKKIIKIFFYIKKNFDIKKNFRKK